MRHGRNKKLSNPSNLDKLRMILLSANRNIHSKKDSEYLPIYRLYYMVVFSAIREAFDYVKPPKDKPSNKWTYKYQRRQQDEDRQEAQDFLLKDDGGLDNFWPIVSTIPSSELRECINDLVGDVDSSEMDLNKWSKANEIKREIGNLSL